MSVQSVGSVGASYPQFLEKQKKTGRVIALAGGTGAVVSLAKICKGAKHPYLVGALGILSALMSFVGISSSSQATQKLKEFNSKTDIMA